MAIGASILANSRPYEGLSVCVGAGAVLLFRVARAGAPAWRAFFLRVAPSMAIVLSLTAVFIGVYFQRTTGNPFLNPYVLNRRQYAVVPAPGLIWQALLPTPEYRYPLMRAFYIEWELPQFLAAKTARGFALTSLFKVQRIWFFFFGPALTIGLLMAHRVIQDRRLRPLLWVGFLYAITVGQEPWFLVHYAAPVTGLLLALMLQGARHLRVWRPDGRSVGLFLVRAIPLICLMMIAVRLIVVPGPDAGNRERPPLWCAMDVGNHSREQLIAKLEETGERHLVFVRYQPRDNYHNEWVYNAADIDNARVVFARELDPASDRALTEYFKDRQVWLVKPDEAISSLSQQLIKVQWAGKCRNAALADGVEHFGISLPTTDVTFQPPLHLATGLQFAGVCRLSTRNQEFRPGRCARVPWRAADRQRLQLSGQARRQDRNRSAGNR
jgi:hypothetical protein